MTAFRWPLWAVPVAAMAAVLCGCPRAPQLAVSATAHHFGVDPATQTYETEWDFEVWNAGEPGSVLAFSVEASEPWIEILPGPLGQSTGADDRATLTARIGREYAGKAAALDFAAGVITVRAGVEQAEIAVTTAPEYYAEVFTDANDLDGWSIAFAPNGGPSYYGKTVTPIDAFPTDPAGGFVLDFGAFGDPVRAGLFGDAAVPFYGADYATLHLSSAGWISFGAEGNDPSTAGAHFAVPQISLLPLDAAAPGAQVSFLQDAEKLTITYANCPGAKGEAPANDTQIDLYFDGRIRLSFLHADPALTGIVGLGAGAGEAGAPPADFIESDLVAE